MDVLGAGGLDRRCGQLCDILGGEEGVSVCAGGCDAELPSSQL